MSLQPKDLIHGGFFLHADPANVSIYRYSSVNCGFQAIGEPHFQGFDDYGPQLLGFFVPIPLDPQILEEWFGFEIHARSSVSEGWSLGTNPVTKDFMIYLKRINDGTPFFYRNGHFQIRSVHELQRLYLALTGNELEGGPK